MEVQKVHAEKIRLSMKNKRGISRYFKAYTVANIMAMIRNNRRDPAICEERCDGRTVVISGATSGIGYLTARKYASMGASLVFINRNPEKSVKLEEEIRKEFGVPCRTLLADLGKREDILRTAEELGKIKDPIDVLIHNAGVFLTKRELTEEGLDKVFVVHHLSSFMINLLLSRKLVSQDRARILLISSEGHRFAPWGLHLDDLNWEKHRYTGLKSYGSAKLAQLQTMMIFGERFCKSAVTINAMHPGAVRSETGRENGVVYRWIKRNIYDKMLRPTGIASDSIYYLGISKEMEGVSGKFFNLTTEEDPAPPAVDREAAGETWEKCMEMAGIPDPMHKKPDPVSEKESLAGS
jgi:NAD(P)-dependent dehydrogenase (short-subunit alcohol dehydrogenase family)